MTQRDPRRYGTELVRGENSQTYVVDLVGRDRRVLEIGCASGAVTGALAAAGCKVVAIEVDPAAAELAREHADRVVVADVAELDLLETVGDGFDVVVCADVLEHVVDPVGVLARTRAVLAPDGFAVISIPNVAHGDLRLALSRGEFEYRSVGLLDETHLRFFTRDSVEVLLREAGYVPIESRTVEIPLFATELGLDPADFDAEVVAAIEADPEALVYQFVLRAVPEEGHEALRALHDRAEASRREVKALRGTQARLERQVDELLRENGALRIAAASSTFDVEQAQAAQREAEHHLHVMLSSRTFRYTKLLRRVAGRLGLGSRPRSPDAS